MNTIKKLLTGTLILSTAGILSHLLGFFFKIYLSESIGLTEFGMYQMLLPISALCMSICCGGIQTGIQKMVAESVSSESFTRSHGFLTAGILITLLLSIPLSLFVYCNSSFIAAHLMGKETLTPLLQIIALTLAPSCIHNCINAYFLGCSKTMIPSMSQLLEQCARLGSVFFLVNMLHAGNLQPTAATGAAGMLFSEIIACLFCSTVYLCTKGRIKSDIHNTFRPLLQLTIPLSANRIFLHLFQSLEAMIIPSCLCIYGLTYEESLSFYGVITGMAMSLIMLPSTFIHSFALMLLPEVSNAQSRNNTKKLQHTCQFSLVSCLYVGILFTAEFITFGEGAANVLFHNSAIGNYIRILAWLCPFMYLTSSFFGIINGLGKTGTNFIISMICTLFRIAAIWFFTPRWGIQGLLFSFLLSQLLIAALCTLTVRKYISLSFSATELILIPGICAYFASAVSDLVYKKMPATSLIKLLVAGMLLCLIYGFLILGFQKIMNSSHKKTAN